MYWFGRSLIFGAVRLLLIRSLVVFTCKKDDSYECCYIYTCALPNSIANLVGLKIIYFGCGGRHHTTEVYVLDLRPSKEALKNARLFTSYENSDHGSLRSETDRNSSFFLIFITFSRDEGSHRRSGGLLYPDPLPSTRCEGLCHQFARGEIHTIFWRVESFAQLAQLSLGAYIIVDNYCQVRIIPYFEPLDSRPDPCSGNSK